MKRRMKIFFTVVYILAVLFTFHQATYCGYGAASAPVGDAAARAYWLKWYAIFGYSFLALLALPLLALLVWLIRKIWVKRKLTHCR